MSNIVKEGLIGYWHYKEGFKGNIWENIAPETKGKYNGIVNGVTLKDDGAFFDGVDDFVLINNIIKNSSSLALEVFYYHNVRGVGGSQNSSGGYPINIYKNSSFRLAPQKHYDRGHSYGDVTGGTYQSLIGTIKIFDFQWHQVLYQYNNQTKMKELYINGELDSSISLVRDWNSSFDLRIGCNHNSGLNSVFTNGMYACVRLYDRALTAEEARQNYKVGKEIGLTVTPPPSPPSVVSVTTNKSKISDEPTMNQSIIKVRFDKDVSEYVARLNGTDYSTGVLVHQGGSVLANVDAQVIIDWNELSTEGENKINIYGKGLNGVWTPHSSN